jgi:deazaflavin-dependent oxidoreductase (nitroreductase family)
MTVEPSPDDAHDFNSRIIAEFRANEGRVGGALADTPIMLIHHIGAKSGVERVTPLVYTSRDDGRYVIVASNGGSPAHPAWYHNLKANPRIEVEVGAETFTVLAEPLEGARRTGIWAEMVAASPALRGFEAKVSREIPLFILTRER